MATDPQTHMEALNALAGDARTQVSRCAAANMPDYAKLWRGRLDALEAGVQALREKEKNDHGAGLAAGGNDTGPSPTETASCIMDYPTAWAFIREQHPDPNEHDPRCSWVQASGGILCDCHVLNDEYARRKAARSL